MSRRTLAAIAGVLVVAACGSNPTGPAAPAAATTEVAAKKKKTAQCSDYRPIVAHLISLVQRETSGDVRITLLADLESAYAALDPAACDAKLASMHLQQFIANVEANSASISPELAVTLIRVAEAVIGYLAPFVV